jgi:hypothetical protein
VVAYDVIACLLGLQKKRVTVAVPNNGAYDGFEKDHVLEMPCLIDKSGYKPLKTAQLPVFAKGLSQRIKAYEALTAEAAWKCDFDLAYQALLLEPAHARRRRHLPPAQGRAGAEQGLPAALQGGPVKYFLGVDSGGTKIAVALRTESGAVRVARVPGANLEVKGVKAVYALIKQGVDKLARGKKIELSGARFCLCGIDFPRDPEMVEPYFRERLKRDFGYTGPMSFENDAFAALRAGTTARPGFIISLGTALP